MAVKNVVAKLWSLVGVGGTMRSNDPNGTNVTVPPNASGPAVISTTSLRVALSGGQNIVSLIPQRSAAGSNAWSDFSPIAVNSVSYDFTSLTINTDYDMRFKAVGAVFTVFSNIVTGRPIAAPSAPVLGAITNPSGTVRRIAITTFPSTATALVREVSLNGGLWVSAGPNVPVGNAYFEHDSGSATSADYRARGFNAAGESVANSNIVSYSSVTPGAYPLYTLQTPIAGKIGGAPVYKGSFIPVTTLTQLGDSYGSYVLSQRIAMGSTSTRMYITGTNTKSVGEFSIPALVLGSNISDLNVSAPLQNFKNYLPPVVGDTSLDEGLRILGLGIVIGKLVVSSAAVYDNSPVEQINFGRYESAANINTGGLAGMFKVAGGRHAQGGPTPVPSYLQAALGCTHVSGHGGTLSILANAPVGISCYGINGADIANATDLNAEISSTALMDFTLDNGLYMTGSSNINTMLNTIVWNYVATVAGMFFIPNTRTLMVIGYNWDGTGTLGYKIVGQPGNVEYAGHGCSNTDGYQNYYWLFDANDFAAVKAGTKTRDQVAPYEHGAFPFSPFDSRRAGPEGPGSLIRGTTFDPVEKIVYVNSERGAAARFGSAVTIGGYSLPGI